MTAMPQVTTDSKLVVSDSIVTREIVGETLLVPITGTLAKLQEVFSLNETGAFLWSRMDGETTLSEVGEAMAVEFEVDATSATQDVLMLAQELFELGVLERSSG